ncbi:YjeF-related protein N-terminus-domain-containing protein [Zopfochytrium polystomum]|nr:YjeF-related protein N-terminus-domain-containing protein [Zopfochytrium polystomum]
MSASQFIGLQVKLFLRGTDSTVIEGRVAAIDEATQAISLVDAYLVQPPQNGVSTPPLPLGTHRVPGSDILDLQIKKALLPPPKPVPGDQSALHYQTSSPHQTSKNQDSKLTRQRRETPAILAMGGGLDAIRNLAAGVPLLTSHGASPTFGSAGHVKTSDPTHVFTQSAPLSHSQRFDRPGSAQSTFSSSAARPQHSSLSGSEDPARSQSRLSLAPNSENNDAEEVDFADMFTEDTNDDGGVPLVRDASAASSSITVTPQNRKKGRGTERREKSERKSPPKSAKSSTAQELNPTHQAAVWADTPSASTAALPDFDFQASLALFDKQRVFSEIAMSDFTDPATLLVSHNRIHGRRPAASNGGADRKPMARETVLDASMAGKEVWDEAGRNTSAASGEETGNDAEVEGDDDADDEGNETDIVGVVPPVGHAIGTVRVDRPVFQTSLAARIPALLVSEANGVEARGMREAGVTEGMIVENGGRAAAMLVLQALGGARRFKPDNHNGPPSVVVLAGSHRVGAFALCAARNLANHGVDVFVHTFQPVVGGNFEVQYNAVIGSEVKLISDSKDLPSPSVQPIDLIIDGMAGSLGVRPSERVTVGELVRWANLCKANKLSLDMPTGLNGDTGLAISPNMPHIKPRWTLALGIPKAGLYPVVTPSTGPGAGVGGGRNGVANGRNGGSVRSGSSSQRVCGEVFLADVGLPKRAYRIAAEMAEAAAVNAGNNSGGDGIRSASSARGPFGDKFLVAVSLVED